MKERALEILCLVNLSKVIDFFFFKQNNYTVTSVFELIGKTGTSGLCLFKIFPQFGDSMKIGLGLV